VLSGPEATAAAYSDLLRRHRRRLLQTATGLEGGTVAGEELLQGALARTWNHFEPTWDDGAFVAYVRVAMVNAQRSRWRRPLREDPHDRIDHPGIAEDAQGRIDDADELDRALGQLSDRQRKVVVMRYYDDLSEQQTAQALSCSVGTVKSQTSRAISRLRRLLDPTRAGSPSADPVSPVEVGGQVEPIASLPEWAPSEFGFDQLARLDALASRRGTGDVGGHRPADDPTGEFPVLV
jgi:RNA polymerase sigma-70 factor (sigma-E family)